MNYKKIIKNRTVRIKILYFLSFIPDGLMIRIQYRIKTGHRLNLKNPRRFTEKLQWYKLYYKNPLMIQCVDKYDVREYVKSKGFEEILVPCIGIYDSPDEIDWDSLPDQFVMKDTLGCGGNAVIIVKDKNKEDVEKLKQQALEWVKIDAHKKSGGREWPYYSGKKHRIIFEQYIESMNDENFDNGIMDYKFFCFDGKVGLKWVDYDRFVDHKRVLFTPKGKRLNVECTYKNPKEFKYPKAAFDILQPIVDRLAEGFPHSRIDLYLVNNRPYFGEITFYSGSGYELFNDDRYDIWLGDKFNLPREIRK